MGMDQATKLNVSPRFGGPRKIWRNTNRGMQCTFPRALSLIRFTTGIQVPHPTTKLAASWFGSLFGGMNERYVYPFPSFS